MSEVTQEDREAAARAGLDIARLNERDADALRQGGEWDEWSFVQAFARHRTTALAALEAESLELRTQRDSAHAAMQKLAEGIAAKEAENAELRAEVERLRGALETAPLIASTEHPHTFRCRQDAWLRDVFTPALGSDRNG